MDKKVIALIIVAVIVVGAYASYYAYATTVLMPEDLKVFKQDLEKLSNKSETSTIKESDINTIESYNALSLIPQSTRDQMADNLTNYKNNESKKAELEEAKQNFTTNRYIASRYDLILKGDVANDIRSVYDQKVIDLLDKMLANIDKQATDIRNGDSKAYANDLREMINLMNEYEAWRQQAIGYLQDIVTKLGG